MTDDTNFNDVEQELLRTAPRRAPAEMRTTVLDQVNRELRSARWDRRLAQVAAALTIVAVGLTGAVGWQAHHEQVLAERERPTPRAITEVAECIRSVTDEPTARSFEKKLLAWRSSRRPEPSLGAMQRAIAEAMKSLNETGKDG